MSEGILDSCFAFSWWMTGKREVNPQLPVKIDLPGYQLTCAARERLPLGQLGECERAKDQLSQLIALRPGAAQSVRLELGKWYQPHLVEHWIGDRREAGLEIPAPKKALKSKFPAALSPSPSPHGVIGIEPENVDPLFPR